MTLADFLSRFPHLTTIDTGGGCTALTMSISADRYVLLTDDNYCAPTDDSVCDDTEAHLTIALYTYADGCIGGREADDYNYVNLSDAAMLIESWNADGECERCGSYGEAHTSACPLHPDHDPTPYCNYCGARYMAECNCGPLATND